MNLYVFFEGISGLKSAYFAKADLVRRAGSKTTPPLHQTPDRHQVDSAPCRLHKALGSLPVTSGP